MRNNSELIFSPLESYQDFLRNPENVKKRGVYVWGFCFVDTKTAVTTKFIPYYVGKHRSNIHRRIQEHVKDIRYGTHKIFRTELLSKPEYFSSTDPDDFIFLNIDDKKRKKTDLPADNQLLLTPHLNTYIDNLFITYVSINHLKLAKDLEERFVDYLERYVQEKIGTNRIIARIGQIYPVDFQPKLRVGDDLTGLFKEKGFQKNTSKK